MKRCVLKSAYDKARTYDRKGAFELLGDCSLALVVLCDDKHEPCIKGDKPETGWVWLAASGTAWLAATPRIDVCPIL